MYRKTFFIVSILCLAMTTNLYAQDKKDNDNDKQRKANFEQFKAKRVAYITEEVGLTTEESQAFWPICNELQEKKFDLNRSTRKELGTIYQAHKRGEKVSDSDYEKAINLNIETNIKEAELDKVYFEKFKKVLSAEKIFKYQRAEQRFAKQMFGQAGNHKRGKDYSQKEK